MNKRKHDGFLKYVFSKPVNAKALFEMASRTNKNLADILAEVDLRDFFVSFTKKSGRFPYFGGDFFPNTHE